MNKKLLRTAEVANILNVTEARVYSMAREGFLPVVKLGRHVRVDQDKLNEWIENGGHTLPGGWKMNL
ncbi:helix-turn-helix domain-containing protein [Priestia megaterium]|uniref:helix-turn-helix domain-containing protein n=1 Tax=Priestia megaterium TaxID=1404 RepID=UPI00398F8EDB